MPCIWDGDDHVLGLAVFACNGGALVEGEQGVSPKLIESRPLHDTVASAAANGVWHMPRRGPTRVPFLPGL